jgi:hypothetical protein
LWRKNRALGFRILSHSEINPAQRRIIDLPEAAAQGTAMRRLVRYATTA